MSVHTVTSIGKPADTPALTLKSLTGTAAASETTGVRDRAFSRIMDEQAGMAGAQWLTIPVTHERNAAVEVDTAVARQREKNQAAIRLLDSWMQDGSRYDEETWPIVKKAIEENRLSARSRFRD